MLNHSHFSIKKQIYDRIAFLETVSKADLLEYFSITSSSMTRMLEDMLAQKLILVSGLGTSTGGRKPILFQTNPHYRYLMGLEISRISSSLGLFDLHLNRLSAVRWEMDHSLTPERLVELVVNESNKMLHHHHIAHEQILGMGIGAVGPLDPKKGIILEPEYFPSDSWSNVPICKLLEKELNIPTQLDNGANTALLAEHWALRNEACEHMLYVHAGVNIRSSIMSGGQILRGAADTEGAIGQMIIQTGGPRLSDKGNYGSLEAYVSVPSLEERVQSHLKIGRESSLSIIPPECVNFPSLVNALKQEDALVRELFIETASYLGVGLANLINTVHPEYVIMGGALINADPIVYHTAIQVARKNIYHYPKYNPIFTPGILKEEAVVTGAALQIMQSWEK
ncbi:ROK family protein [Paenibacillus sp. CFBP 13594]|uniref:ROK family protein n=1 Tax=Paenibacillus sp. CFBP 13594 TaxID=2774037 RepID=UPI0017824311|nr:ROK family protein [Paenibacillus sp. CFBP 13594]MBD8836906.1 ROK family protein [Paenibacillus sp. CFBP 13594]